MKKPKGGPGSGRKPEGFARHRVGPNRPYRSGVSPAAAFPCGRNADGTPRHCETTPNDPKPAPKR